MCELVISRRSVATRLISSKVSVSGFLGEVKPISEDRDGDDWIKKRRIFRGQLDRGTELVNTSSNIAAMIFRQFSIALLGLIAFEITAKVNPFELASDMQTCIELCDNCGGTARFEDDICQCHVVDDDQKGAECIGRIKRQAEELGLDVVSCDLANNEADRTARCILSPLRRFKNRDDADLIAKYFMENPLGDLSSLLSSKSKKEKDATASESEDVASVNGDKREAGELTNSQIVGAANPVIPSHFVELSPLLGGAPTWLQPQPLMAFRNGFHGTEGASSSPGFVGAQNPNSEQVNYVGSSQLNSWDFYNNYPPGTMLGMSPYSYIVGAPNPVRYEDGNQDLSYVYGYDPSLVSSNYIGPSFYSPSPVEDSDPHHEDAAPLLEESLDESAKTVEEPVGGSEDSSPNLGANKVDSEDEENSLESIKEETEEEYVSNSKRTADDAPADTPDLEEINQPSLSRSKYKMKRRQSKLKSKASFKQ